MKALLSPSEMKKIDELTMKAHSLSSFELMKQVAAEMAEELDRRIRPSSRIHFLVGPGNNGGDAYCLARFMKERSHHVSLEALFEPSSEDAKRAFKFSRLRTDFKNLSDVDVIVDGVFGAQGKAKLSKALVKRFREARKSKAFKVSLDVPSGVCAESGQAHKDSFRADLSLCVAYPKWGFLFQELAENLGELSYVGKNFLRPKSAKAYALEASDFHFAEEERTKHKRHHCAIIAGSSQSPGAAFLAAEAAHRTGLGYVHLCSAQKKKWRIELKQASFQFHSLWKWEGLKKMEALVVGPGGSPSGLGALDHLRMPQVIDADALKPAWKLKPHPHRIFTPHPGEAATLLSCKPSEILRDRLGALDELCRLSKQSVYLKGAPGLLGFHQDPSYYVNLSINPIFARAGSGDILSGILGGFLAQANDSFREAVLSSLVFQSEVGEVLRGKRASISSDQLMLFSEAFERIQERS